MLVEAFQAFIRFSQEYFTENSPFALSRTGKACYNETKKAPHPAQKQTYTASERGNHYGMER